MIAFLLAQIAKLKSKIGSVGTTDLQSQVNALSDNFGGFVIRRCTKTNVDIADGSPTSPESIIIDCSSDIPSGKSISNAIAYVKSGSILYNLPWLNASSYKYLAISKIDSTSITLENTSNGWGTVDISIILFLK